MVTVLAPPIIKILNDVVPGDIMAGHHTAWTTTREHSSPIMDGYWLDWKQRTNADDADLYVRARDMLCHALGAPILHFLHARQ